MASVLLKTEPGEFSYDDLEREGRAVWSGVSNPAALIQLRLVRAGDAAWIYHTGDERAIVGLARVTRGAYADPQKPGTTPAGEPKFAVIDVEPAARAANALTLSAMKGDGAFEGFQLLTHARLSVMAVPQAIDRLIRARVGV